MHNCGQQWERHAERFLTGRGLSVVARNFRVGCGEIDLIMRDDTQLVFIEVRYRSAGRFGDAAASVGPRKQLRITQCAAAFLHANPTWSDYPCRFDVIAYDARQSGTSPRWIRAAFE